MAAVPAARAEAPQLDFPLACTPGADCWIIQYTDVDPGPEFKDYTCGRNSYDGHGGTDIAVADFAALRRGPVVLAAAPGRVVWTRDGMADELFERGRLPEFKGRACGNGVAIHHGEGWETMYCHLQNGSVVAKMGEMVASGDPIAKMGLSGVTEFPHLHFQVMRYGRIVDPFVGDEKPAACGLGAKHMWTETAMPKVRHQPIKIANLGFSDRPPEENDAWAGRLADTTLPAASPYIAFWAQTYGVRGGDRITLTLIGPDGLVVFRHEKRADEDLIRAWRWLAVPGIGLWEPGEYIGVVEVARGDTVERATRRLTVPPAEGLTISTGRRESGQGAISPLGTAHARAGG
ncbi:MAG: M23 family metallopeptidase [Alphaproteobacteria bacterium]|nr:M23 family metallopeptidase [Alphaproteobacteria bacterium]